MENGPTPQPKPKKCEGNTCSGNGQCNESNGVCQCNQGYYGNRCENREEQPEPEPEPQPKPEPTPKPDCQDKIDCKVYVENDYCQTYKDNMNCKSFYFFIINFNFRLLPKKLQILLIINLKNIFKT